MKTTYENKGLEGTEGIPEQEQVDAALSPVSVEEMAAELKNMEEALADKDRSYSEDDKVRLEQVRQSIKDLAEKKTPEERQKDEEIAIGLMKEAMIPDWQKEPKRQKSADQPKMQMKGVPPNEPPRKGGGDDGGGENESSVLMHEGHAQYDREACPSCGGSGRKFIILPCWRCHGYGSVVVSEKMVWSQRRIKTKNKGEAQELKPDEQPNDDHEAQ